MNNFIDDNGKPYSLPSILKTLDRPSNDVQESIMQSDGRALYEFLAKTYNFPVEPESNRKTKPDRLSKMRQISRRYNR